MAEPPYLGVEAKRRGGDRITNLPELLWEEPLLVPDKGEARGRQGTQTLSNRSVFSLLRVSFGIEGALVSDCRWSGG